MRNPDRLSANFEFYPDGRLKAVFINAPDEQGQKVVEASLERLIQPARATWLSRLAGKCKCKP